MASSYSTRIRLEKQGDGDNENSWGLRLNQNVIDLVDEALAGYAIVSVSGSGITLSTANGSTDQSRNATLSFEGTLTADTTITIPAVEKQYFLRNASSGSFAITMKTAGGSAITLPQSQSIYVACDGTNIYRIQADTSVSSFTANSVVATSVSAQVVNTSAVDAVSGDFSGTVSATSYVGDGSSLTGITGVTTGTVLPYAGTTEPSGYLFSYGQAVSRTTYSDLFSVLSTTYGVGDGSTTFNLPDLRGYVVAGKDDMGGASADRLTDQSGGLNGDTLGDTGGAETHTLTVDEMPAHTHTYTEVVTTNLDDGSGISARTTASGTTGSTGGDGAHNNVQPTIILNYIIKT